MIAIGVEDILIRASCGSRFAVLAAFLVKDGITQALGRLDFRGRFGQFDRQAAEPAKHGTSGRKRFLGGAIVSRRGQLVKHGTIRMLPG